ncbi:MAG: sugar porter family MFS transporter, partial [Desulfovibrio sp.]|nr:sugar porter family MFS transporter [Desulfovibrio sp.]
MAEQLVPIAQMPLRARHWYIFAVASLEQLIGAALSTIAGIIIPLILLLGTPHLTAAEQGILGAAGLVGIAVGSVIIGKLMDSMGYLVWFRLCPLIIAAGACGVYFSDSFWPLAASLFVIGLGVGGGYSLDSGYISEVMPAKWESFFVGLAKATCSVGFVGGAAYA